ncbi:MAG: hypothetical protein HYS20_06590 [Rhodocyclales bacterium]|nr:hypothetical protein [Rhodocyclales bacterium]
MAAGNALGYEAAPAFSAPLRFFLTAPLFGVLAGVLLLVMPELLESRWTPGALALTHLVTVGFMLTVMLGAMFQILPVVAGAPIPATTVVATIVHLLMSAGAVALVWGLGAPAPDVLVIAVWLLGAGCAVFFVAAAIALLRVPITQATPRDMRFALIGLGIAILLGLTLAMIIARGLALPLVPLLKLHVGWAWLGGVGMLLGATAWIVVPMFQITPPYPAALTRYWAFATFTTLLIWSATVMYELTSIEFVIVIALVALAGAFIGNTLALQRRSRKSIPDITQRAFQLGLGSLIAGLICILVSYHSDSPLWPVLSGVLILHGGFISVMLGMLYKIVPFLAWLHLTQAGVRAPNMKKLQPDAPVRKQLIAHAITLAALIVATLGVSAWAGRIAGMLMTIEFAWLLNNMINVIRAYRRAGSA